MPTKKTDKEEQWLKDSAVHVDVFQYKGRWEVSLVFIDTKDPKHFLVRKIADYHSEKMANIYADNMRRTAAKDERGTQKVNHDDYHINDN
ncbi:MAG: hypothetical protein ABIO60_05835 [Aquaticitalea sp.]